MRLTAKRLIESVGKDAALDLMRRFGGRRVPQLTQLLAERIERDEMILRDIDADDTYRDVGARHSLSPGRVARIVNGDAAKFMP